MDLAGISNGLRVEEFYKPRLEKTKKIKQTNTSGLSKNELLQLVNNSLYDIDTIYFSGSAAAENTQLISGKKQNMEGNVVSGKIWGYDYYQQSVFEKDTIAMLGTTAFSKAGMLQDADKHFVALYAEKVADKNVYNVVKNKLSEIYGNGAATKDSSVISWKAGNAVIQLQKSDVANIDLLSEEEKAETLIKYFYVNDKYLKMIPLIPVSAWSAFMYQ